VPIPTWRMAVLLALSGVALLLVPVRSWTVFWAVELVVIAVFLADAFAGQAPRRIGVRRELPGALRVGDEATMAWTIDNRGRSAVRVSVTDALWPSLNASRRRVDATLPAGGRLRATATLQPSRRGRFPLDDISVRVRSPLGFAVRHHTQRVEGLVRVYPAFPSRDAVQLRLKQVRTPDSAQLLRSRGGNTEFHQLREYTPDDEFRSIDWAATARARRPIVREHRIERDQTVMILLDNGRVMAGSVGGVPRVEHAMDAVLGLTAIAIQLGDRVGLMSFDSQVRSLVVPSASHVQRSRVAEAMYLLDAELAESAYGPAFAYATAHLRRRALYVVLTDLAEAVVADQLVPPLRTLVRTHLVIVAAVEDPVVAAWSRDLTSAEPLEGVYRAAAAISALESRRRAAATLRAAGAMVIDAQPGKLATDVVDAYLELKATGRL
jgi:uncharacterized protein (DUF58 family)